MANLFYYSYILPSGYYLDSTRIIMIYLFINMLLFINNNNKIIIIILIFLIITIIIIIITAALVNYCIVVGG